MQDSPCWTRGALLLAAALSLATSGCTGSGADWVFRNGTIYTVDAQRRVAQAIAIDGGRIVYVGDDAGVATDERESAADGGGDARLGAVAEDDDGFSFGRHVRPPSGRPCKDEVGESACRACGYGLLECDCPIMSAPAQKPRPAPVSTSTLASSSSFTSSRMRFRPNRSAGESALSFSGRLRVIQAIRSSIRKRRN